MQAGPTPQPKAAVGGTVETVQLLRFVAAAMVLVSHVSFFVHHRADSGMPILNDFAQGVALFFVISGFIMTVTATPKAGQPGFARYFALSRLIRIVPLYWALNAAKLLGLVLVPGMIVANPTVSNVIFSLLFLPAKNADGQIEAFYGVGWSLNFEMAFYALFALCLLIGRRAALLMILVLLVCVALSQIKTEDWPTAAYLLSPGLINFVWGILIGEWYLAGRRMAAPLALGLVVLGWVVMLAPIAALEPLLVARLHLAAIVLGCVALEPVVGRYIPRLLTFLGDASYSIYLTHPMFAVLAVVVLHKAVPALPAWGLFWVVMGLSLVFASATYVWFERPITRWLRDRFIRRSTKG